MEEYDSAIGEQDFNTSDHHLSIALQRLLNAIALITLALLQICYRTHDSFSADLSQSPFALNNLLQMAPFSQYFWCAIYLYLIPFAFYSVLSPNTPTFKNAKLVHQTIGWSFFETLALLIVRESCIFCAIESKNGHLLQAVALLCQIVVLTISLRIYYQVFKQYMAHELNTVEILILRIFGSIYVGFIFLLTLEQIYAELLVQFNLSALTSVQQFISCLLLEVTLIILTWMSCRFRDCVIPLPFLITLVAILRFHLKQLGFALFLEISTGLMAFIASINFVIQTKSSVRNNPHLNLFALNQDPTHSDEIL